MDKKCIICGKSPADKTHIKSKGSGGTGKKHNIVLLCRDHHMEQHRIGIVTFYKRHKEYRDELIEKGWELEDILGKETLWHAKN